MSVTCLVALTASGCVNLPHDPSTRANRRYTGEALPPTSATMAQPVLSNGAFIGIAMSGGGSRAANFSAAALLELDRIGLLEHATAISSVSGSSLTAAYYGLYGRDKTRFNKAALQQTMIYDFDRDWIVRWLIPHNILRYWLTPFDRSDIMKTVVDDVLFEGREKQVTFKDLQPPGNTRILINATSIAGGETFVFTDEAFEGLGSRLDKYPVSHAVMASAAFPAAFNSVTLEDYRREDDHRKETAGEKSFYKHLYDGGPSGNLGLNTLKDMLHKTAQGPRKPERCLLVLVDAFPIAESKVDKGHDKRDLRSLFGYLVDDNLMDAFDDLLRSQRQEALRALGYPHDTPVGDLATWEYRPILSKPNGKPGLVCHVWHITMQGNSKGVDPQLALQEKMMQSQKGTGTTTTPPVKDAEIYRRALNIATDFRLINPAVGDPHDLQNVLFDAVQGRVKEKEQEITDLLNQWGLQPGR